MKVKRVVQSAYVPVSVKENLARFCEDEGCDTPTKWASRILEQFMAKYLVKRDKKSQKGG